LFASKCAKCQESFSKNEFYIRTAFYRRYHPDCFRCNHCDRLLVSGDEYYLRKQNQILCQQDFQQLNSSNDSIGTPTTGILPKERKKEKRKAYGVHTYLHPFGCDYGVKEGIDGVRSMPEVRSVWGALFSRYIYYSKTNEGMTTNQSTPFLFYYFSTGCGQ
ncbi:unnamed protein product, partial [Rotaria magnacalcarata]